MSENGTIGQWLEQRCKNENLSLRKAAARSNLSHSTISAIIKGARPLPETIRKLAAGFGFTETELLKKAGYLTLDDSDERLKNLKRELKRSIAQALVSIYRVIDNL